MATTASAGIGSGEHVGRPQENLAVRLASAAMLVAVVALLGVLYPTSGFTMSGSVLVWVALVVAASVWPIDEHEGRPYLALDLPVLLACAFSAGPFTAGAVALIGSVSKQELRGRMSLSRSIYNHAQVALSVIVAGVVYQAVGGDPKVWPMAVFAAELALLADAAVNYLSVALVYALSSDRRIRDVLRTLHVGDPAHFAAVYACLGIAAAIIASLYVLVGDVALVAVVVLVVMAREALNQAVLASSARRELEARREALRRVDERIAEERADERARIAGALHDDVLQSVFDVTIRAHVIRECYRRGQLLELENEIPPFIKAGERIADELRDVIQGLRRSRVGLGGLVDSLSLLVAYLRDQTGICFVEDLDPSVGLGERSELAAYQVAREALTNAARHSNADTVWVALQRSRNGVELRVLDNGEGFDPSLRREKHFGLELMEERVLAAGGRLELKSTPGHGVSVVAWFEG